MDALVAAAIHDAKNELSALGVWIAEAQREFAALSPARSPALDRAMAIAATLSGQLVELLALYRSGEGSLRLAVEDHYLDDFLTDVMSELHQSLATAEIGGDGAKVQVLTNFSATQEVGTWAFDAYLVKFALLDALRNAMRKARQRARLTFAAEPGGGIRFDVEDDGPGYPDDIMRGKRETEMSTSSSGLGLTFAQLIATRHATPAGRRGQLSLSNDGMSAGGARFSLTLP